MSAQDPGVERLLAGARFTPLYEGWLPEREKLVAQWWKARSPGRSVEVLLVNATRGLQFYPAIVDFFLLLKSASPELGVTSASYFEEIEELHAGVSGRGLSVVRIPQMQSWSDADFGRFDLVIAIGPSPELARLMSIEGLKAKLVLLDCGFYHQMIEGVPSFLERQDTPAARAAWAWPSGGQKNRGALYTCQPFEKVANDLGRHFALDKLAWRRLRYIPMGFGRRQYYRADKQAFDVALLGTDGRDYSLLVPFFLKGKTFLFLGAIDRAPAIAKLKSQADVTVVSRVDEDEYAKLLAICRCVAMPLFRTTHNVFLSVVDAFAAGVPIVTSSCAGFEELQREAAPIAFHHDRRRPYGGDSRASLNVVSAALSLARHVREITTDDARRRSMSDQAVRYTKDRLDMYWILERILEEQLPP